MILQGWNMKRIKKWVCLFLLIIGNFMGNCLWIRAEEGQGPGSLYASSAVLMDGDSGRILYEKNGYEPRPMASTTKIMTCILALEEGNEEDLVTASSRAASSPKVRLGVTEGETFRFGDLLYSLMLESHNDAAVMIAEHLDGSVEKFAERMNEKAREIGCKNTYFITPNGLDASVKIKGKEKVHSTTAADLSRIMRYCIMESPERENFLNITRTDSYSFYDGERKQNFACYNHNAFLGMMEGALTGKTGFTANAGYCYVGALQRDGKTLIVALLACGWPNNKSYKWKDTVNLMNYGLENYSLHSLLDTKLPDREEILPVKNGQSSQLGETACTGIKAGEAKDRKLLMREGETVRVVYEGKNALEAPVKAGTRIGTLKYLVGDQSYLSRPVYTTETVEAIDFYWCVEKVMERWAF